jgi:CRP-like cAMP-binding protein
MSTRGPEEASVPLASSSIRSFEQGDILFRQGDRATISFVLEEGSVRLLKKVRGETRSLAVLTPGDLFGESALLPEGVHASTAVALTSGLARALEPASLTNLVANDPEAASAIIKDLARRLQEAEDQIEIAMLADTQSKVVAALMKLAEKTRGDAAGVSLAMSPVELATRVGLDVDTVKRTVQQLRDGQYLRVADARLEVPDVDALRRLYALLGVKEDLRSDEE